MFKRIQAVKCQFPTFPLRNNKLVNSSGNTILGLNNINPNKKFTDLVRATNFGHIIDSKDKLEKFFNEYGNNFRIIATDDNKLGYALRQKGPHGIDFFRYIENDGDFQGLSTYVSNITITGLHNTITALSITPCKTIFMSGLTLSRSEPVSLLNYLTKNSNADKGMTIKSMINQVNKIGFYVNDQTLTGKQFNNILQKTNHRMVKLTTESELHDGQQFHNGLNISLDSCHGARSGITFVDNKRIITMMHQRDEPMKWIRSVTIPDNSEVYIKGGYELYYRTTKVILGERQPFNKYFNLLNA